MSCSDEHYILWIITATGRIIGNVLRYSTSVLYRSLSGRATSNYFLNPHFTALEEYLKYCNMCYDDSCTYNVNNVVSFMSDKNNSSMMFWLIILFIFKLKLDVH